MHLFPTLTPEDIQEFLKEWPESEFASPTLRGDTMTGELVFRCGVRFFSGKNKIIVNSLILDGLSGEA